ncbi:hypothetical protein ACU4GD_32950 [Cupriavidus basilensis]
MGTQAADQPLQTHCLRQVGDEIRQQEIFHHGQFNPIGLFSPLFGKGK